MRIQRFSKSLEKYKIIRTLFSNPMTYHNNPEWWIITPTTVEKVGKYGITFPVVSLSLCLLVLKVSQY